jgi:hypothetical protein
MKRLYPLLLALCLLLTAGCSAALQDILPSPTSTVASKADVAADGGETASVDRQPSPDTGASATDTGKKGAAPITERATAREAEGTDDSPLARPRRRAPVEAGQQQPVTLTSVDRLHRNDTLTQDTHWQGVVVVEGALTVPSHVTLTVVPGTVVRFRPDSGTNAPGVLLVEGRLAVNGTADRPVSFLPAATPPLPGSWQGIVLLGSDKRNTLEHCRIEGAATGLDLLYAASALKGVVISACDTGIHLQESQATLQESDIIDTQVALDATASELELKGCRLKSGSTGILAASSSLFLSGCSLSGYHRWGAAAADCRILIQKTVISGNGSGLYLQGGEGSIGTSRIGQNAEDGLHLTAARIRVTGNDFFRNGRSGLITEDGLAAVWSNAFRGNGLYDLEHRGGDDLRAMNNWWQPPESGTAAVGGPVSLEGGRVLTTPPLGRRPTLNDLP